MVYVANIANGLLIFNIIIIIIIFFEKVRKVVNPRVTLIMIKYCLN